jgi:hypothetical protein
MKWVILFGLLVILAAVIAARYRQQIKMVIYVWQMFRKMRRASGANEEKQIDKQENKKDAALVRCAKCGVWIPQNKSLILRSGSKYCSTTCLEKTAQIS